MKFKICALLFLLSTLGLLQSACASDSSLGDHEQVRVLQSSINENCTLPECKQDLSVVYVRSSRYKNDNTIKSGPDLHFILSTFGGSPAYFVTSAKNNSYPNISWSDLQNNQPHSIQFMADGKPARDNTIGVMISKIFFWLDNEQAEANYVPGKSQVKELDLKGKWQNVTVLDQTKDNVHVQYDLNDTENNGKISIRFMITSATQKYVDLPSLMLTPKAVHSQLTIEGFDKIFSENATKRLGMELAVITKGKLVKGKENGDPQTSFDDEYSPGMFINLKYLFGEKNLDSSFFSFMPNAYINKERMIAKTIDTKQNDMEPLKDKDVLFNNHAFYGFYGEEPDYVMNQLTITFGSKGQEFFTKTNLTEFSFVAGLNVLPEPTMSLFIQLVVIIGSGLSLLVLLIFPVSIYLMARKMRNRRESALLNNQEGIY